MPKLNFIFIPYFTSLNLIKGREYLLNRQLIYTGISIYLSFKNLINYIGALLEISLSVASPYRVDYYSILSPSLGFLAGLVV